MFQEFRYSLSEYLQLRVCTAVEVKLYLEGCDLLPKFYHEGRESFFLGMKVSVDSPSSATHGLLVLCVSI